MNKVCCFRLVTYVTTMPVEEPIDYANEAFFQAVHRENPLQFRFVDDVRNVLKTRFIHGGKFFGTLYIVDENPPGRAYIATSRGRAIRMERGPYAWNPVRMFDLRNLITLLREREYYVCVFEDSLEGGEMVYVLRTAGTLEFELHVSESDEIHPQYGQYIREAYRDYLANNRYVPYSDFVYEEDGRQSPVLPRFSYIEPMTKEAAINRYNRLNAEAIERQNQLDLDY